MGGAEKVVSALLELFPGSPVYTSVVNRDNLSPFLASQDIRTSCLQGKKEKVINHKKYFPFMPYAFKHLEIEPCDIVISSSSSCAKMVKVPKGAIHICYCHTPMRYAYNAKEEYLKELSPLKRPLARILLSYMRRKDKKSNKNIDYFIANSNEVKERIKKYYNRDAIVINPCVDVDKFKNTHHDDGYYFILTRLVEYKKVNIAVKAFLNSSRELKILGQGPERDKLISLANGAKNITFIDDCSDERAIQEMENCKAFLFPGFEDFGITPVEAMAAGKPVICYGKGGLTDSVIDGVTGIYFNEQTEFSLLNAIEKFECTSFDSDKIREHALTFSKEHFKEKIYKFVTSIYNNKPVKDK